MRRSFALRLGAAFAGVGIAAAALTAILVNVAFGSRFTGYLDAQQQVREQQLVAILADSYSRSNGWVGGDLSSLTPIAFMDGGTLRLLDASGQTVWAPSPDQLLGQMAEMHRQMMGGGVLGPEHRLPVAVGGEVVGTAVVRFPATGLLPQDVTFRASVNRLLLFGGLAAGLLALLLGIVLARRATAPARELARAARGFASGDRGRRVRYDTPDEFGEMARAFNAMGDAVEEEDRLRRDFAAEVAHEVRTPLAIIRSQIEAIQDGVLEPSSSTVGSLHEETLRLTRLMGDLETLAPADVPRVFDRFFRGRGVRASGSGIGLTVVRELVEAHGGSVEVSSEPGAGAAFTVRLPGPSSRSFTEFTVPSHAALTVVSEGGDER